MACQCIMCVTTTLGALWSWRATRAHFSYTFPGVRVACRVRIALAISMSQADDISRWTRQSKLTVWCWEQRNLFTYHCQRVFQQLGHLPTVTPTRQALPGESHVDQDGQAPKSHRARDASASGLGQREANTGQSLSSQAPQARIAWADRRAHLARKRCGGAVEASTSSDGRSISLTNTWFSVTPLEASQALVAWFTSFSRGSGATELGTTPFWACFRPVWIRRFRSALLGVRQSGIKDSKAGDSMRKITQNHSMRGSADTTNLASW